MSTPTQRAALPVVPSGLGRNIDYQVFMDCVHCGLCLGSCPTYVETGNENDSPRGRIYLWRAVTDGRAELTPEVREHLDLCLECKACETACPSGVQYGQIIGSYKKDMAKLGKPFPSLNFLQRWALFHLTPYAGRMRWALAPLRLAQRLGLRGVIDAAGQLLPRSLRGMQEIVPRLEPHYGRLPELLPAEGKRRARVALFMGCAADAFFPQATLATARVLQKNGCDVLVPRGQGCCGALHEHAGLVENARAFAAANCQALAKELDGLDAVVNNAGGCGPVLKHYGDLLRGTPSAGLGEKLAAKSRDVHEFLADLGPVAPTHPLPLTATYHDACGLSHGQKIRSQPRQLLAMIPELKLVPLPESEHCCGAAGSYNITQPEMAGEVGRRKAQHIASTGADAVFTGNVGCLLQIARHLRDVRPGVWVAHPVEALWASYSGARPTTRAHEPRTK
jgi:glycolate oxidase iron-sulfur subunit